MKPGVVVADEMFPEGAGPYTDLEEAGGSGGLLMDLAANEKSVHADFYNAYTGRSDQQPGDSNEIERAGNFLTIEYARYVISIIREILRQKPNMH
ncbi:hypothetical protein MRX96_000773 [Rhipicephalus microplus]|uniref:COP9 signalosome complex subunit 9 isoform X1 n=1 Tax=Rhipicephalus microplus TaxID=6941 RepID=UPI003F6B7517